MTGERKGKVMGDEEHKCDGQRQADKGDGC